MEIVVSVGDEVKFLVPALKEMLETVSQLSVKTRGQREGESVDYRNVERKIAQCMAQIEQAAHQGLLQGLDIDAPRLLVRGKTFERIERSEGNYYTMAGACLVLRTRYREVGQPEGALVDTISLRTGAVLGQWLPQTAQAMAHQVQMNTAREAEKAAKITCRLPYSDSSFDRVTHAVGAQYLAHELDVEQKLIESYPIPDEASGVSVSLDRVSVPMEEPHPTEPGKIVRAFRMAYTGTVTVHDGQGEALYIIRYGRMPKGDAIGLVEGMASDVDEMRKSRPDLKVGTIADGAADVWGLLDTYINPVELGTDVGRLIDLWHNIGKLGKAARVIYGDERAGLIVEEWKMRMLNKSAAAGEILKELRDSEKRYTRVGDGRPVHEAITYLENHQDKMDYATARQQGRPVGSGAAEASCKSLFEVRFKRSGARWKQGTGEDIVRLRALALSDRWDAAMDLILAPLRTPVQRAACAGRYAS